MAAVAVAEKYDMQPWNCEDAPCGNNEGPCANKFGFHQFGHGASIPARRTACLIAFWTAEAWT
jgi:hypothetical protein